MLPALAITLQPSYRALLAHTSAIAVEDCEGLGIEVAGSFNAHQVIEIFENSRRPTRRSPISLR